jgi:hypothetical protein
MSQLMDAIRFTSEASDLMRQRLLSPPTITQDPSLSLSSMRLSPGKHIQ